MANCIEKAVRAVIIRELLSVREIIVFRWKFFQSVYSDRMMALAYLKMSPKLNVLLLTLAIGY